MNKTALIFLFLFWAADVFAVTADEVFKLSAEKDLTNNLNSLSYEIEYEWIVKDNVMTVKETVDGTKIRMDIFPAGAHYSFITDGEKSYISGDCRVFDGRTVFEDYKVVKDTKTVTVYGNNDYLYFQKMLRPFLNIYFLPGHPKNSRDYAVVMAVKDPEEAKRNYKDKVVNRREELTSEDFALYLMANFEMIFFIDKKTMLHNSITIILAQKDSSGEESESGKDKNTTGEKKQTAQNHGGGIVFGEIVFSDYKKVQGADLFYPAEVITKKCAMLTDAEAGDDGIASILRVKSFKMLKSGEADSALFIPANIKRGKGKIPKAFSRSANTYGGVSYFMGREAAGSFKEMKESVKKSITKESIRESVKEGVKESVKESVKETRESITREGAKGITKNIIKGLGGF